MTMHSENQILQLFPDFTVIPDCGLDLDLVTRGTYELIHGVDLWLGSEELTP